MENSVGFGFVAVFAVSGSVVFIARQVHKRLLSDFMKKIEHELGGSPRKCCEVKKRVRFAEEVMEVPASENRECRRRKDGALKMEDHNMPLNRQVLYKGILKYKTLKAQDFGNFL
ncbi:hypothetical protein SLEP1_g5030 [Rubroshorea leprosula]|uniref:Uncharacterized protein n=1 Tax=Rubroshorea leprosula TaxID=152421 RepID=A0AAV5HR02_9ROSI|nr:hypothetical protein SLEP1_g5030 [Rubroshorea leprosula]